MSASEKLKALVIAEAADREHVDDSAQNELLNVLPQIVAVVEAAHDHYDEWARANANQLDLLPLPLQRIGAALAALDEALS